MLIGKLAVCLKAYPVNSCDLRLLLRIGLLITSMIVASSAIAQDVNPLAGNIRAEYAGGVLFRAQCATCHGADAAGIETINAPDLTRMWLDRSYSDGQVFQIVRNGVAGTIMPAHNFTDTEVWMLVSYLRSVAQSGVQDLPAGDAVLGERLFQEHCAQCHSVAGQGAILGPNLRTVLAENSLDQLRLSIRDPNLLVRPSYKTVRVTEAGSSNSTNSVLGILKNEDAFSIQIVDQSQRLRSFATSDSIVEKLPQSLMPAFDENQLSETELLAILNFIQSASENVTRDQ